MLRKTKLLISMFLASSLIINGITTDYLRKNWEPISLFSGLAGGYLLCKYLNKRYNDDTDSEIIRIGDAAASAGILPNTDNSSSSSYGQPFKPLRSRVKHLQLPQFYYAPTKFSYGVASLKGRRPEMQDAHQIALIGDHFYYGIFDGHGYNGMMFAEYIAEILHENINDSMNETGTISNPIESIVNSIELGFDKTDKIIKKNLYNISNGGSCAVIALIDPCKNILYIANLGDSRAIISNKGIAYTLTKDHKPSDPIEAKRIMELGGEITENPQFGIRINGGINVTRAFGDFLYGNLISKIPDITKLDLVPGDEFLILACDGVFEEINTNKKQQEAVTAQEAADIVKKCLGQKKTLTEAAQAIANTAYVKGSTDNISVIVILLKDNVDFLK